MQVYINTTSTHHKQHIYPLTSSSISLKHILNQQKMKSPTMFISIFVLLSFISTSSYAEFDFVLDSEGDPVMNFGNSYYVIPVFSGNGGGLQLAQTRDQTCPLTVVQNESEESKGLPAIFSSPLRIPYIPEGTRVNIEFNLQDQPSTCLPNPAIWTVEEGSSQAVKIQEGGGGEKIWDVSGKFRISKVDYHQQIDFHSYKLQYCGDNDSDDEGDCKDLGIVDDYLENNRRLVVKDGNPLVVHFVKAEDYRTNNRIIRRSGV